MRNFDSVLEEVIGELEGDSVIAEPESAELDDEEEVNQTPAKFKMQRPRLL